MGKLIKMERRTLKIIVSVISLLVTLYGLYAYVRGHNSNQCKMTFMFEYPEYIPIALSKDIKKKFPRYGLYVYGEGSYARELWNNQFKGIPVLFVSGNAGSYRQVRSIASIAFRVSLANPSESHFNVFSIDFKEELSGLYGGILEEQTAFVLKSMDTIKKLYASAPRIILIGHSMGGIIVKAVFANPSFVQDSVSLIYTLATPHKEPVISFDIELANFYDKIANTWGNRKTTKLKNIPVISIGGGERDVIVKSSLTQLDFDDSLAFHVLTPSIPGVWMSNDHLAITWCKQFVLTVVRSMFDLIDEKANEVTHDLAYMKNVLHHHFVHRNHGGNYPKTPYIHSSHLSASGQMFEQNELSFRFSRTKTFSSSYLLIPVLDDEHIIVVSSGITNPNWVFAYAISSYNDTRIVTTSVENLSNHGSIVPSRNSSLEKRVVNIISSDIKAKGFTHVVVMIPVTNTQIDVLGERYRPAERTKHLVLPSVYSRLYSYSSMRIQSFPLAEASVFYSLSFSGFSNILEASTLTLDTRICRAGNSLAMGYMKIKYLWKPYEEQFFHIMTTLGGVTIVPLKPHYLPPVNIDSIMRIELVLDPECSYVLFASSSYSNIFSQFVKFYGLYVPGFAVAIYLCLLSGQLYSYNAKGSCLSLYELGSSFPTFTLLVVVPWILQSVYQALNEMFDITWKEMTDSSICKNTYFYNFLYRNVLYMISYGLVMSFSFIYQNTVIGLSYVWIWIKRQTIFQVTRESLTEAYGEKFKISFIDLLLCAFLEVVAIGLAGSVSLMLGYIINFFKLLTMCVRYKAEEQRRGFTGTVSKWQFHLLLNLLWLLAMLLTIPALFTWFKQLPFSFRLLTDPHIIPCVFINIAVAILWQLPVPVYSQMYFKYSSYSVLLISMLSSLFGVKSIYRQLYFICGAFIIIGVQQSASFLKEAFWKKKK